MRKFLLGLFTIAISLLAGLVLFEAGLRIVSYSRPPLYRYDFDTGTSHMPGADGWFVEENRVRIAINDDGIRGPAVARSKPDGVWRIAVLGDSFAEGLQVTYDERFTNVMQHRLAACDALPGTPEVINFGVSGYGQSRELLMLQHRAAAYKPDLVLVLFHGGNDFRNNMRDWKHNPFIPYHVWRDGKLVLDDSFRRYPDFLRKLKWSNLRNKFVLRSRVLQLLQNFYERVVLEQALFAKERAEESVSAPPPQMSLVPPVDERAHGAWQITEALLLKLRDDAEALVSAPLWLASVPPAAAVYPDPADRERVMAQYGIDETDYVENRLASFAAQHGIGMARLTAELRAAAERSGVDPHYHEYRGNVGGHWNAMAHRVAGEAIADVLCAHFSAGEQRPPGTSTPSG